MSFPPAFLEDLRARLSLSDIAGKRIKLTRAGREFKACCPFHNEKSPSFYINDEKHFFHCFGCGAHGDIIGFVMRHDRLSFPEAVEILAQQAGVSVPRDTPVDREKFDKEKQLLQLLERATSWFEEQLFSPAGREALAYLHGRGLTDDALRRFRLGYAPQDSQALLRKILKENYKIEDLVAVGLAKKSEERSEHYSFFRNRVIFPVADRRGRTVAFGGRVLGEGEPKYLNSPDHSLFHKGQLLYGLSRARTASIEGKDLIVVEGYMDVIALVEAGYSGALAPLGTALTEDQLALLWKLAPPQDSRDPSRDYSPILCFDSDAAGVRAATRAMERALPLLTPHHTLRFAILSGAKDPDDLLRKSGKSAMDAVLKQAKPMVDIIWDTTVAGRQLRTPEERGAFITTIKQRVGRIENEALRHLYLEDIQKRLSETFQWRSETSKPQSSGPSFGKSFKKPWANPEPIVSRKLPMNAQTLRERALLALILNHPSLFDEFGEDMARITFLNIEFENLRQAVIEHLSDASTPIDKTELHHRLIDVTPRISSLLADLLSDSTYIHAAYARPERTLEQARQGWKSIWNKYLQELLQADLHMASRRYADDNTPESLTRLLALRSQLELLNEQESEDHAEVQINT